MGYDQIDPVALKELLWPDIHFYDKQLEIIYSVINCKETVVGAGNKLGKDFVAGFICVYFYLTRSPCRVVCTSAKEDHLDVLFGEIVRFIQTAKHPLDAKRGGPLLLHHRNISKVIDGEKCPISYLKGMVAGKESIAAMQGHHVANVGDGIPRALFMCDESSSVPNEYYNMARTWFNRALIFGNTWDCDNFFKYAIEGNPASRLPGGDLWSKDKKRKLRSVIKITAEDSPNVVFAREEIKLGREPSGTIIYPGVKDWFEYQDEELTWDEIQRSVSHRAEFWKGEDVLLIPSAVLNRCIEKADTLPSKRKARAMGIDPGEGGDDTCWSVVDELGLIYQEAFKTPDTSVIPEHTIKLGRRYNLPPEMWFFDRSGGGWEHADQLRKQGFDGVNTVGFGEGVTPPSSPVDIDGYVEQEEKHERKEEKYLYMNRRAEMYGMLRLRMKKGWAVPGEYYELIRQLGLIPVKYDGEGRMRLPPKDKSLSARTKNETTLKQLLGCSPDEADSVVLAVYGMETTDEIVTLGRAF